MKNLLETDGSPVIELRSTKPRAAAAAYNPLTATSLEELQNLCFDPATQLPRPSKVPQPIIASAVATAVLEEASTWLNHPLPAEWAAVLTFHAETLCAHNARFRRRLDTNGNLGRDRLWSFMRHWLCAIMARELPDQYRRLPSEYNVGRQLTAPPPVVVNLPRIPLRAHSDRPGRTLSSCVHGLLPELI